MNVEDVAGDIESTVTRLLQHMKQLLEILQRWARREASEEDVSDVYVQLGNEFNLACRKFTSAGVQVNDLGDVPQMLREILERALAEEASTASLERHLPSIRGIIVNLLRQLKHKQTLVRHPTSVLSRTTSPVSVNSQSSSRHASSRGPTPTSAAPTQAANTFTELRNRRALERAASKRFSAHHLSRMMNGQSVEQTLLPTTMPTPAGRAPKPAEFTGMHVHEEPRRRVSGFSESRPVPGPVPGSVPGHIRRSSGHRKQKSSGTVPDSSIPEHMAQSSSKMRKSSRGSEMSSSGPSIMAPERAPSHSVSSGMDASPSSEKESSPPKLHVFLRLGNRVRKAEIDAPPSLVAIRLRFVDMFGYTPSGEDVFPEMLIQDEKTGIEYELTEATARDVKPGSLLTLKAKTSEELSLEKRMDAIQEGLEKLNARLSSAPAPASGPGNSFQRNNSMPVVHPPSIPSRRIPPESAEGFRQELAVIRQISAKAIGTMRTELGSLTDTIKELQALPANGGGSRTYMTESRTRLDNDCTVLLRLVDEIQDIVDSQRESVVQRGIWIAPKRLDLVRRELARATADHRELTKFVETEKPVWKRTWESELNTIVEEEQFVKLQEELIVDLEGDIANAQKTFDLVAQVSEELSHGRTRTPQIAPIPPGQENQVKKAVLDEVSALHPDHSHRAQAVERVERLRQRELEQGTLNEFETELSQFVDEDRLTKSGGVAEVERKREERDKQTRELSLRHEAELRAQREERRRARKAENSEVKPASE